MHTAGMTATVMAGGGGLAAQAERGRQADLGHVTVTLARTRIISLSHRAGPTRMIMRRAVPGWQYAAASPGSGPGRLGVWPVDSDWSGPWRGHCQTQSDMNAAMA
jgi:hypothetical protein